MDTKDTKANAVGDTELKNALKMIGRRLIRDESLVAYCGLF